MGYIPWGCKEFDMRAYTYTTYTGILCKNQYLTFKKIQIYIFLQPLVLSKYVTQSPHGSGFHIFPYTIFKLLHFLTYLLLSLHHISNLFMIIIRFLFKQTGLPWWLRRYKESAFSVGDLSSILGSERSPGEGNGYPLQHSCL